MEVSGTPSLPPTHSITPSSTPSETKGLVKLPAIRGFWDRAGVRDLLERRPV